MRVRVVIRLIGIVLLFVGIFGLFNNPHHSKYEAIIGDFNKNIKPREVGVGYTVEITFPSNVSSLKGYYAAYNVTFEPKLTSEQVAKGLKIGPLQLEGKERDWGATILDGTEGFDISVKMKVPDDPKLEGETIHGVIKMNLTYPVRLPRSSLFENKEEYLEKSITIHIFSGDELAELLRIKEQIAHHGNQFLVISVIGFFALVLSFGWRGLKTLAGIIIAIIVAIIVLALFL